tara:strand:- start:1977 stop:2453 length:477 start_codon:yes stop_codon:yes gene_type:complete
MIVESNKYNAILYGILGSVVIFGFKRWIYGGIISILSVFILIQSILLSHPLLYRYQNISGLLVNLFTIILVLVTLFILYKSTIKESNKLFSISFLVASIGFTFYKKKFNDKPIFQHNISNYISSLLLMITIITVSIIPDNEYILEQEYRNVKTKLTNQ